MSNNISSGANKGEGELTSGTNLSYWIDSVEPLIFAPLLQNITTETVVIGGGISGLSVAYCLAKAGRSVVLIEDGFLCSGETGRTTAHITNALDDRYSRLEKLLGKEASSMAGNSHSAAIDFIENVVHEEKIECEFTRCDGYLFLHPGDTIETLHDELEATNRAGISTMLLQDVPGLPSEKGPCLKFPGQARFHPVKYLKGVADAIIRYGGKIYTETHASKISESEVIANDFTISCKQVVVATNSPVNDLVTMHTKQHPYRTYVIGALIPRGSLPHSLWWDTGDQKSKWRTDPYHYVRIQSFNNASDLLIAGGEDHKTGQADDEGIAEEDRFQKLISWVRNKFSMAGQVLYQWSGQVLEPVDSLAFIGRNPGDQHVYIATGDSGNGITHGTIAGLLISDLIQGKENVWEKIYHPSRITLRATGDFLKEVGNMTAQYLDYLAPGDIATINDLPPAQGAIVNLGATKAAVYKGANNELHAFSAICPHLGCVLHWNKSENSFDCPCHGSRFTCHGKVINGPAQTDLKKIELKVNTA